MTVFDCFMASDELDILELRLHELAGVVDQFLFVEALETFTGQPKPPYVGDAMQAGRFAEWGDRLAGVTYHQLPPGSAWEREAWQRNAIGQLLHGVAQPDDIVLVSDVDEIPRAEAVTLAASLLCDGARQVALQQTVYFYHPQCLNQLVWYGTRAVRYADLGQPQRLRATEWRLPGEEVIADAGWHFSYFMSPDAIRRKVAAYSHTEVNQPQYTSDANITEAMDMCRSLVPDDGQTLVRCEPHDLPAYMLAHPEKYGLVRDSAFVEQVAMVRTVRL